MHGREEQFSIVDFLMMEKFVLGIMKANFSSFLSFALYQFAGKESMHAVAMAKF